MVQLCPSNTRERFWVNCRTFLGGAVATLRSTGVQGAGSQEQVQHENAKSTQYRGVGGGLVGLRWWAGVCELQRDAVAGHA